MSFYYTTELKRIGPGVPKGLIAIAEYAESHTLEDKYILKSENPIIYVKFANELPNDSRFLSITEDDFLNNDPR